MQEIKIDEPDFKQVQQSNITYFVLGSLFTVFLIALIFVGYLVLKGFG